MIIPPAYAGGSDLLGFDTPPILLVERFCVRPDLVERVAVVKFTALHHHSDGVSVLDVGERAAVEDDQVGELARFERAEVTIQPDRFRTENRRDAESVVVGHSAGCDRPQLPVDADALHLAVAAHAYAAPGLNYISGTFRDAFEAVFF